MLTLLLAAMATASPRVDLGANLDAHHTQGVGLSRVALGFDVTTRFGERARFGLQAYGWEAVVNRQPETGDLAGVWRFVGVDPQRSAGLLGVWTPLQGTIGSLPLSVDVMGGLGVLGLAVGGVCYWEPCTLDVNRPVAAGVFGGGARVEAGRAGALRLRARATLWRDRVAQVDLEVPDNRHRVRALVTPEIGWVVRLGGQKTTVPRADP